jgi:serine/threonine-protein kinase
MTKRGLLVGTPEYMAPEQAGGERADRRSDIYSLGVVLYQMMAKRVPFQGDSALTIAVKQMTEAPRLPSAFAAVNGKLEAACLRALSKLPDDRFGSAREMRSALRAAINLAPGRASSPQSTFPAIDAHAALAVDAHAALAVDAHTASLVGAIADQPRRGRRPLVIGLALATLFAGALGVRAAVRARRLPPPPPQSAAAALSPGGGAHGETTAGGGPAAPALALGNGTAPGATTLVAAGTEAPGEAPSADDLKPTRPTGSRRSKAALPRDNRERGKRGSSPARGGARVAGTGAGQTGASGGKGAGGVAPTAGALAEKPPRPGNDPGASAGHPTGSDLVTTKSALAAPPPASPAAPLDASRARVSITGISSTSAIPGSNIRAALSRAPLERCYRDALHAAGAAASGTAVLHLKIDIAGYVTGTVLEGAQFLPGVKACVEKAARGARIRDVDTGEANADVTLNFASAP